MKTGLRMTGQGDASEGMSSAQDIRLSRDAIAHEWYYAFASLGSIQLDRNEGLGKFLLLTEHVIDYLLSENPERNAARTIGEELASLPCVDPLAVEVSGKLWARNLTIGVFLAEPTVYHPRFLALLGGMSSGFFRRARELLLEDQEDIRSAMAADLMNATEELEKYKSHLEVMLADRTRELREREEQFRTIAETSLEGIYQSTDDKGTIVYANNAFARMLGYTKDELIGRTTFSMIDETEFPRLARISEDLRANRPVDGEYRMKHKDGHLIDVYFSVVPTMLNGRIIRSGILRDITERKREQEALFQSEERYRTLAEAAPAMIFIIGPDDRVQYVNSFAAAFLHLDPAEVVGKLREDLFPYSTDAHQKKNILKVLKDGKTSYIERETSANSRKIWLATWLVPLRDASGNISAVMGVSRDISKRKRTEREIRRARDLLEKRVQERTAELSASQARLRQLTDQLVTSLEEERRRISRELHDEAGQALISLKYNLASIKKDIPDNNLPARQRLVDSLSIIDQIMSEIRTITHSLRPPVLEVVGINLVLKDYCEEYSKLTGIRVLYHGEEIPGLPDEVGISLYRFVQEAFTNIVKHSGATEAGVNLHYENKQVILVVSDNGRGIEDSNRTGGIGLIGVQERFNLLGGCLQIQAPEGHGLVKTATLPWPRAAEEIK